MYTALSIIRRQKRGPVGGELLVLTAAGGGGVNADSTSKLPFKQGRRGCVREAGRVNQQSVAKRKNGVLDRVDPCPLPHLFSLRTTIYSRYDARNQCQFPRSPLPLHLPPPPAHAAERCTMFLSNSKGLHRQLSSQCSSFRPSLRLSPRHPRKQP